jgi:hypothetical protein
MSPQIFILILLAIIFVVSLIFIIGWITVLQSPPVYPPAPTYSLTGFGMRCTDTNEPVDQTTNAPYTYIPPHCSSGLICHGGFCLKDIGTSCNSIFECVPGTIVCNAQCSATGRTGLNGQCSTNEDCDSFLVCDTSLIPAVCKRPIGGLNCTDSSDCVTGSVCSNNVCIPVGSDGESCLPVENADSCEAPDLCINYSSNFYFCQSPNVTAGGESSTCYYWNDTSISQPAPPLKNVVIDNVLMTFPSCNSGLQCNAEGSLSLGSTSSIIPTYGQCGVVPAATNLGGAGWFGGCSVIDGCQFNQVCLDGQCSFPTVLSNNLINYEPLSCQIGNSSGLCLNNYVCKGSYPTGDAKCVGVGNGIPAIDNSSCVNGISSNYNVVTQTFQDINSDPTNRNITASWTSAGLTVPSFVNSSSINQINFSTFENSNFIILAIFHLIGSSTYIISSPSGNTTIAVSPAIVSSGRVAKVGYTTTGNYYCVIEYLNFANIYFSTFPNFSDCVPYFTSYTVRYYLGGNFTFSSSFIYSVSVDDRVLNPSLGAVNVRVFMVTGNNGSYNTSQYIQQGSLSSISLNGPSLASVSNSLNTFPFNLLSYNNNFSAIDNTIVWAEAAISRTMDITQASQYTYAYQFDSNQCVSYFPNPTDPNRNIRFTPIFPILNKSNFFINKIAAFNSRGTDLFNNPFYYVGNQQTSTIYSTQVFLGLTCTNQDEVLAGDVNLQTILSMPYPAPVNDVPNYRPKITLLTRTCQ